MLLCRCLSGTWQACVICRATYNSPPQLQVTTEGDAFIVAFHDPLDAVGWALHVQLALLEAPWLPELLQHAQARLETCPEGRLLFRGLRVRMAINTGIPAEIIVRFLFRPLHWESAQQQHACLTMRHCSSSVILLVSCCDTSFVTYCCPCWHAVDAIAVCCFISGKVQDTSDTVNLQCCT